MLFCGGCSDRKELSVGKSQSDHFVKRTGSVKPFKKAPLTIDTSVYGASATPPAVRERIVAAKSSGRRDVTKSGSDTTECNQAKQT